MRKEQNSAIDDPFGNALLSITVDRSINVFNKKPIYLNEVEDKMKGKRRFKTVAFTTLLVIGLCFGSVQTLLAYTTVYLDLSDPLENSVASFQFEILEPDTVDVSSASLLLPSEWMNMSVNRIVSAFDPTGNASLPNGKIAVFDFDVILGNFELGDQSANVIPSDLYSILIDGSDYIISNNVVPIPSALILLGCGLAGIVGIRRRQMGN